MDTLLLGVDTWDFVLDASGNMAVAKEPYALSQDVASACRTVLGEVYYDTSQGVDYFGQIYGKTPPANIFQEMFVAAALTVPDVVSATCIIESYSAETRKVTGQIQFIDTGGNVGTVSI